MRSTTGYGALRPEGQLTLRTIERRELRPDDLAVRVTYCGVCFTDLSALRTLSDRGGDDLLVPGHEFVGEVVAAGTDVTRFRVGDQVAVGNIVDSCGACAMCRAGQENFCVQFPTLTYGGRDRHDGTPTLGGFSGEYVVRESFAYHRPENLDPAAVAPLLCAGVTVWEPLRRWCAGPGMTVGVAGLGGLGHLAVRLAKALGARVVLLTRTPGKSADARKLGADDVVVTTDEHDLARAVSSIDLLIDTISAPHDLGQLLRLVALDGTLCSLGYLGPISLETMDLLVGRKSLASAGSGGRPSTQELLDFCGEHGITADVEVLPSAQVATAMRRLAANDVRYRFVLDLSDLPASGA
ncbi:putative zinc-type alcohol dehydrogenase-like protein [Promicromonospora umidemergens]|uniref:alcohol dehydrogenase (NADP(+)) n=1 Tax=Promicromonospora umidemergens TaxID=629679 RepID=A0ABP8Y7T7_9MICO|nr:NAD(P)-dependent alcohol dehydrogenase [Promicromonospora umidemergens]MCP2282518.1 putative zinc-type alcohol dehydrogenase-like protein [Promicromonospora umidemergens]